MDRRHLLQLAGASAIASPLWLAGHAHSQPHFANDLFTCGVASGSPTVDGVVLWTRLDMGELYQEAVTLQWELAHDAQFKRLVQKGSASTSAVLGYSVHVEVPALEPDRWYHYRFMVGDAVSATGRTRTLPLPGAKVARWRLAYASCQRWEHGYYRAYRHMRDENLDAVVFLGDYIYEYPGAANPVRWPNMTPSLGFVLTLEDYRARYALHKSDPDLQAMHAACPWFLTWDDHEVQNDYAGLQAGNSSVADVFSSPATFAQRRAAAYQAYYENMPIRASTFTRALTGLAGALTGSGAEAEMRIYNRVDLGGLASLYLLDTRQYKDPQACTSGGGLGASAVNPVHCAAWNDPKRTLLGLQQEAWLHSEFDKASARGQVWNVLGQSTLFGQRDNKTGPGQSFFNDGWDGYSAARTRMTDALQKSAVLNPVFLGGDVHENWVGHVKADYAQTAAAQSTASIGVEFCGTSITSRSNSDGRLRERLAENPHFVFADAKARGYGVVEFTPGKLTTTLRAVDDARRRDTGIQTLARFTVQAGRSVVEPF
jgi:alkaline phosphatase D